MDAFNATSSYLKDLFNIDNIHFEHMVHRIYPAEIQLYKANASDTKATFLDCFGAKIGKNCIPL